MTAFDECATVLRARGCRCPLMWNGVIPVPATVCDQTAPGDARRHHCLVLDQLAPVPEAPAPLTASARDVILDRNGC